MQRHLLEDRLRNILLKNWPCFLENFPLHFLKSPVNQREFLPAQDKDHLPGKVSFLTDEEETELHTILKDLLQINFTLEPRKTFRLRHTTQDDLEKVFVHFDPYEIVGTIFLDSTDENSEFQLSFCRHRETGWMNVSDGLLKVKQVLLLNEDTWKLDRWEIWHTENFQPAKCVWHPGNLYHTPPVCRSEGGGITLDFFLGRKR